MINLLETAERLNEEKKHSDVIKLLKDELIEGDINLYLEKARALGNLNKNKECLVYVQKVIDLDPKNIKANYYLGNLLLDNEENEKAIEAYKIVIELDPNYYNAYNGLGNIYVATKNYKKAIENYSRAVQLKPDNIYSFNGLGNVYNNLNDYEKAIENYNKAIQIDPYNSTPYNGLGNTFGNIKDYEKAIENYNKSIQLDPEESYSYNGLGNVYSNLNDYEKAIENYEKAIKLNPDNPTPYNGLGNVYKNLGNYKQAIINYNKYIKLNNRWDGVYYNRAEAYFLSENYKTALLDYKRYINSANEKNDFYYKRALSRIEEIDRISGNKHYEEIREIITKVKELLSYTEGCVTHFTSLSVSKLLVIENSRLRLSEGAFLNDTSEGTVLFKYLLFKSNFIKNSDTIDEIFTQKPFIGSFVSETKHNDLAMWRMYGKEQQEEAKGCAITISINNYTDSIYKILGIDELSLTDNQDFKFYRVCYIDETGKFIIPDTKSDDKKEKDLNAYMEKLKLVIAKYHKGGDFKDINEIEELLNEISFLVKNSEYSYEKEIRLVVNGVGFEKKIDSIGQPKVYIELASLKGCITKITLGPKVEKSDEWASVFHYSMENDGYEPEIHISHLPYK